MEIVKQAKVVQVLSGSNNANDRRSIRSSKLIGSRESLEYETGINEEVCINFALIILSFPFFHYFRNWYFLKFL